MTRKMVEYTELSNPMLRFLLEDGTELRIKVNLMSVVRTEEKLPDGQPRHEFKLQHCVEQLSPDPDIKPLNLKKDVER